VDDQTAGLVTHPVDDQTAGLVTHPVQRSGGRRASSPMMATVTSEDETGGSPADHTIAALYREHHARLVRLAHLVTGSNLAAQDIVQDTFLSVADRLDQVDNPSAYVRAAVVNRSRGWLRRREVERRHAGTDEPDIELPHELDETWLALERLTPKRRAAVVLRFYEDLSVDQVAEVLGCRPGTAKSLIHRALRQLQELLEP
jgi:RNA polymerase sigma-70 factor (sigma-E family)